VGLFGSITRKLFGGSKSTSESGNKFAGQINEQFSPWIGHGTAGMGQAANILGLGGSGAHEGAMDDYWNSSGGKFLMEQGTEDIIGNRAARGLLRSGGTSDRIEEYRTDLASTKLNEYLGNIFRLNQQSLGAGGLVTGAGQYSEGSGTQSNGGLGKAIGSLLSVFSDHRLKTDLVRIGEDPDGLGRYRYRYHWEDAPREGVMADEVAELRPWALGPEIGGYATVRYDLLEAA
jgi:hypothetical protein